MENGRFAFLSPKGLRANVRYSS